MEEDFDNAVQELKRVDHLFYVSLKYTRTVDVIRSMVQRIINSFDFGLDAILKQAKDKKMITGIPKNAGLKTDLLKETYSKNSELLDYINFYLKLKKILRANYGKREEYRRHVTMISTMDKGEVIEVDIDLLKEYYGTAKNFIKFVKRMLYGEEEEV